MIGCQRPCPCNGVDSGPITVRSNVTAIDTWPLDRAVNAGHDPDTAVVVLDGYPAGPALGAMADRTAARPDLGVLVLGPLEPNIEVLIALASGAFGYLPTCSTPGMVADAVEAMLAGDAVLPRALSFPLVQHLRWGGRGHVVTRLDGRTAELTNREWEVLVLVRQAWSTAEIAGRLVVSTSTIRTHTAALVHKLGVRDRCALAHTTSACRN